jgi:hypothetical protein
MTGFLDDFGPNFLHLWSTKIKSIYKWWKRDTLSLLVKNIRKHPNHWLQVAMMNCQFCAGKMVGRVGHFGAAPLPLQPQLARTAYTFV